MKQGEQFNAFGQINGRVGDVVGVTCNIRTCRPGGTIYDVSHHLAPTREIRWNNVISQWEGYARIVGHLPNRKLHSGGVWLNYRCEFIGTELPADVTPDPDYQSNMEAFYDRRSVVENEWAERHHGFPPEERDYPADLRLDNEPSNILRSAVEPAIREERAQAASVEE